MMRGLWLLSVLAMLTAPGLAAAQGRQGGNASPFQELSGQNQDLPIQIDAATLDVRDKIKQATFSGDVQVVQGDTKMKCKTLVVFYGQEIGAPGARPTDAKSSPAVPTSAQNIRKIEAHGGVTVFSKDQNASGDEGVYDLKTHTITLTGNVVVSQGQDVVRGERVVVDTITGNARVEAAPAGGTTPSRVRALIQPKGQNNSSGNIMTIGPGGPAGPAPRPN